MEWIVLGFLLLHLLLLVGVFVALIHTRSARRRRTKKPSDREEHVAHPTG